jgi:hypothetical protein
MLPALKLLKADGRAGIQETEEMHLTRRGTLMHSQLRSLTLSRDVCARPLDQGDGLDRYDSAMIFRESFKLGQKSLLNRESSYSMSL